MEPIGLYIHDAVLYAKMSVLRFLFINPYKTNERLY